MATFHIKPLDGAEGYLRWKESVLLRLHSVGVAHVLSDEPPPIPAADGAQAAKKWAHEDALCHGHILAALSDHLLPVYVRHATSRALWQAVARTYEPDATAWALRFDELEFREDETLRERVARAEALAIAKSGCPEAPDDAYVFFMVCTKVPDVADDAIMEGNQASMDGIWRSAQAVERIRNDMQMDVARGAKEDRISSRSHDNSGHTLRRSTGGDQAMAMALAWPPESNRGCYVNHCLAFGWQL